MLTGLARFTRFGLASLFFRLMRTRKISANPFELCGPGARILVIRQQNQMGDMLLATPCLRALRQSVPGSWITLLASHENAAVVLNNPHVNEVLVYDKRVFRKNPIALIRFVQSLRRRNFDISIVLSTVSFSITSAVLCVVSGARYKVSYSGSSYGLGFVDQAFHVSVPLENSGEHQTRLGLKLLEHFDVTSSDLSPIMVPDKQNEQFAEEFMAQSFPGPCGKGIVVGIHPGAGKAKNRWPASRFAEIANKLHQVRNASIVVIGGPSDGEVLDALLHDLEFKAAVLTGESIGGVAAVMERLSLLLCNDTGVLHVAAAVGCPTLALFGPTDPSRWAPLGRFVKALRAPGARMDELKKEDVLESAVEMISSRGEPGAR